MRINNYWNNLKWKGQWSNNPESWSSLVKKKIEFEKHKNDNSFWITFDDFKEYFSKITVCEYQYGYKIETLSIHNHNPKFYLLKMKIP